jgi:ATP-dependent Lon protease
MPTIVENNAIQMPLLALRGVVVFPNTVASFDVGRKKSINALKFAMDKNQLIYLVTQKDFYADEPENSDLYKIGCVAKIKQVLRVSDNLTKVLVQGVYRATHTDFYTLPDFYTARVSRLDDVASNNREIYKETLIRRVRTEFYKYMSLMPKPSPDIEMTVENTDDLGYLCDYIAFNINAPFDDKQYVLEQTSPIKRAKILIELLSKEYQINQIDKRIAEKTRASIDETQKEYYLREQLKVISNELYGDESADEIDTYHTKIELLSAND